MFARLLFFSSAPASAATAREVFASCNSLLQVSQGSVRGSLAPRGIYDGDQIFLKVGETGNVMTAQEDGEVHTHLNHRGDMQKFVVERADGDGEVMSGDAVFLTAWTGKRITVEGAWVHALWGRMECEMGDWQKLVIEAETGPVQIMPGSAVFLKGHTGARLDGGSADKPGELHARFHDQGTWQRFIIELADAATQPGTMAPQISATDESGTSMAPDTKSMNSPDTAMPETPATYESSTDMAPDTVSVQAWDHFQLIQSLRAIGFTCPNGTIHPANPAPLQFDCRLWKAAWLRSLDLTKANASIFPSMHVEEAQNITSKDSSVLQALTQFKESDEYCANMLNGDFKIVGVADVDVGMKRCWTQMFSRGNGSQPVDMSCYPPEVA